MERSKSFEEIIAQNIVEKISKKIILNELEIAKVSYGLSTLMINIIKCSLIYGSALIFGRISFTAISHILFCIMRRYCYGIHAKSSINCTVIGIIYFTILPMWLYVHSLGMSSQQVLIAGITFGVVLYHTAPAFTNKGATKGYEIKKKKALLANAFVTVFIMLFESDFYRLIGFSGLLLSVLLTLPVMKIPFNKIKIRRAR